MNDFPHNEGLKLRGTLKYLNMVNNASGLKKLRKLFLLFTSMLLIASIITTYQKGLSIEGALSFALCSLMLNFANKCETLILKIKINKWLNKNEMHVEEV